MRLEEKIVKFCSANQITLGVAESCSGGLIAHRLTNIPGSSQCFMLGIVAYSNASKTTLLKIPSNILNTHGAVSLQTAKRMAQGVCRILKTDVGIATTGIAGPSGSTKTKPVGLTYVSVKFKELTITKEFHFKGNRTSNKQQATHAAFEILWQMLAKNK